jgi:hypothetical protein
MEKFISKLASLRKSSTFLTLKGYRSETGEVADYSLVFNMSYKNALRRSILELDKFIPSNPLEETAKKELMHSFSKSLSSSNEEKHYEQVKDGDGNVIKGIKIHKESGTLHLYGLIVHKKVIMPGEKKIVNHKELTVIKNKLRANLPVSKFRQFKLLADQLDTISVDKKSFNLD